MKQFADCVHDSMHRIYDTGRLEGCTPAPEVRMDVFGSSCDYAMLVGGGPNCQECRVLVSSDVSPTLVSPGAGHRDCRWRQGFVVNERSLAGWRVMLVGRRAP